MRACTAFLTLLVMYSRRPKLLPVKNSWYSNQSVLGTRIFITKAFDLDIAVFWQSAEPELVFRSEPDVCPQKEMKQLRRDNLMPVIFHLGRTARRWLEQACSVPLCSACRSGISTSRNAVLTISTKFGGLRGIPSPTKRRGPVNDTVSLQPVPALADRN